MAAHPGMSAKKGQALFRSDKDVALLVATDAAGEV